MLDSIKCIRKDKIDLEVGEWWRKGKVGEIS